MAVLLLAYGGLEGYRLLGCAYSLPYLIYRRAEIFGYFLQRRLVAVFMQKLSGRLLYLVYRFFFKCL